MRSRALAIAALVLLTALVCSPVRHVGFLEYDDDEYVTANPRVLAGMNAAGVRWALTGSAAANWHPLTWLSHMADVELWGLSPQPMHLVNLALHCASTALLALLLHRMTGQLGPALAAAALWSLHPLRVESVAWIAERKDVLSTALFLLTLLAYLSYAARPGIGRYLAVAGCFALALASKPMVVTLPAVLLLLDFWPLNRTSRSAPEPGRTWRGLLLEKLPLFALALGASAITLVAQSGGGAVRTQTFPIWLRAENALVGYARYLLKTIWPADLAIFYPYPDSWPIATVAVSSAVLLVITGLAIWQARRRPYLLVGWLWFLGTLVPVSGLFVHVGEQSIADRYTYIPAMGLSIILAGAGAELAGRRAAWRGPAIAATAAAAILCALTIGRLGVWRGGTLALFESALASTQDNWLAHSYVGSELARLGEPQWPAAEEHFRAALAIEPSFGEAHYNLGNLLQRQGRYQPAIEQYAAALRANPMVPEVWHNRGRAELMLGRRNLALQSLTMALELAPDSQVIRQTLDQARQAAPATTRAVED